MAGLKASSIKALFMGGHYLVKCKDGRYGDALRQLNSITEEHIIMKRKLINILAAFGIATVLMIPFATINTKAIAAATVEKSVDAGSTWVVNETTALSSLTIAEGAAVSAQEGFSVTMTIDGIETGLKPGNYKGKIILTKTEANPVEYKKDVLIYNFRHALYLDSTGIVAGKSVLPAAGDYKLNDGILTGAKIFSKGENFNGIYIADGSYNIKTPFVRFTGNGGNDFAGYGAAVMATGRKTTMVVDGADIESRGVVRTAIVADGGSNVIVKNSNIRTFDGVQAPDYRPNSSPGYMKSVPWMLGLTGNCRATNLLGSGTTATYINSTVSAERWGALSTDSCQNARLTAINTRIAITGDSGYGAYVDGSSTTDSFYGCEFTVPDYAVILTGGNAFFGASASGAVNKLNADLKLGLTSSEIKSIIEKQTTIKSGRFGVMLWNSKASVNIIDATTLDCGEAVFLVRGSAAEMTVDGSNGARLNSRKGIILQAMDLDKGNKTVVNGLSLTNGPYTEPYKEYKDIIKEKNHNIYVAGNADIIGNFSSIELKGDFYNAVTGGSSNSGSGGMPVGAPPGGTPGGSSPAGGPPAGGAPAGGAPAGGPAGGSSSKNMLLNFKSSKITGMITASFAKHAKSEFYSDDYKLVGEVSNTPCAAVNNGVIVSLKDSTWTVTGTSYLTALTLADGSAIKAPEGYNVAMTVDGAEKAINAGSYWGDILITVTKK